LSRVAVKICGVTEPAGAALAAALGADFLGLNFWPGSPRHLDLARARDVAAAARAAAPGVLLVGVFVNPSAAEIEAAAVAAGLDLVQLSGDETPAAVRALPYRTIKTLRLSAAVAAAAIAGLPPAAAAPQPPILAAAARSGGAMRRDSAAGSTGWEMLVAGFEECWGLLFDTPRDLQPPRHRPPLGGTPAVAGAAPGHHGTGPGSVHGAAGPGREHGGAGPDDGGARRAADYGGTGRAWNHGALAPLLAALAGRRVFVAGGLGPGNARQVIARLQPFAIDVCSGVESAPGRQDPRLLRQLFEEVGDGQVTSAT
jgi:phosphoribosylanthranilate isomerase